MKLKAPAVVGVPAMRPVVPMLRPGGREPPVMVNVMGVFPVAVTWLLYGTPAVPVGISDPEVMDRGGQITVMVKDCGIGPQPGG